MSGSPLLHGASGEAQVRSALLPLGDGDLEGAADCRRAFSETSSLTVGFEEELILLDPITLLPINDVERALVRLEDDRFTCELRGAQLEVRTPPCETVTDACRELQAARVFAADRLAGFARIAAAGVHPTSTAPIEITDRQRYRRIAAECPWAVREGLPCGFHVHVAVPGPERALAVYNAARSFLPELAALAANSPFLAGRDTGLASARLKLNEAFPRAGTPPAFQSWQAYSDFVAWGAASGLIPDATHLWWDLRLHPLYGTLEFRIADAQTRVAEAGAVAAVCQALVAALAARFDAGEKLTVHETERIAENRWAGVRDGLAGVLADLDTGGPMAARTRIGFLLAAVEPAAEALGSRNELLAAWTLLAENGAGRQRRVVARTGLDGLVRRLADDTEQGPAGESSSCACDGRAR
jgi:carboxylate-amine ligase